jgi:YidC/Oxa1 family membrane protein insertase
VEDRRNIILAVLLTGLILFGWPYIAEQFFPTPPPAEKSVTASAKPEGASSDSGDIAAQPPLQSRSRCLRPLPPIRAC